MRINKVVKLVSVKLRDAFILKWWWLAWIISTVTKCSLIIYEILTVSCQLAHIQTAKKLIIFQHYLRFKHSVPYNFINITLVNKMWYLYRVIRNECRGFNNLPLRSPDATPCNFFLWGYVKDQVYVPPLSASILEVKVRIRTATETIAADMRNEIDYRVDVCRITNGAHVEHL